MDWLEAHIDHVGSECLIWPFSCSRGYPQISISQKVQKASRVMCERANGPPPTPKHEAAHSCGRGHQGCIHPQHLSWKTRTENQQDRTKHGTAGRGQARHLKWKLTPEDVTTIRAIGGLVTKEELGRRFNVTPSNIAKILSRKTWRTDGEYTKVGFAVKPRVRHGHGEQPHPEEKS